MIKKLFQRFSVPGLFAGLLLMAAHHKGPAPLIIGTPDLQAISALEFTPEGDLIIGDARQAKLFAIDFKTAQAYSGKAHPKIVNLDSKIAALLGASPEDIMVHDMAVHPVSKQTFLSVSRAGKSWEWEFHLPNDLADANILLQVSPDGEISEVPLEEVRFSSVSLKNPVSKDATHHWKENISPRVDAITDLVLLNGKVYVAGLSNEEFASTLRVFPYPFNSSASASSLEIFHGAHGKWETKSPIRAFVPYDWEGKSYLLAAYLCTPLVVFPSEALKDGAHIKGKTIAELGFGNYPLDMLTLKKGDKDYLLIANSNRTLMRIDPDEISKLENGITEKAATGAGVPYISLPGGIVQQMAKFDENHAVILRRAPNGRLKMETMSSGWF